MPQKRRLDGLLELRKAKWLGSEIIRQNKFSDTQYGHTLGILKECYHSPAYLVEFVCVKNRLNYRVDQDRRIAIALPEQMRKGWTSRIAMVAALRELQVHEDIVNSYKACRVRSPHFVFECGVFREYYKEESRELFLPIKREFGNVRGFWALVLLAWLVPGRLFRWFVEHRESLKTCHRLLAGLSELVWRVRGLAR